MSEHFETIVSSKGFLGGGWDKDFPQVLFFDPLEMVSKSKRYILNLVIDKFVELDSFFWEWNIQLLALCNNHDMTIHFY